MDVIEQVKSQILLDTGTNEFEILEFYIDEDKGPKDGVVPNYFGVNVAKVKQVIESPNLESKEYSQNPCFLGTIPLRNLIVPVIDLSAWLGIERKRHGNEIVIITEFSRSVQGFLVSGVTEIYRFQWKELVPPGDYITKMGSKAIVGIVTRGARPPASTEAQPPASMEARPPASAGARFIQLLDLEHIISDLDPNSTQESWHTTVRAKQSYTALVAEDSPTIRLMLKKNLEAANFRTMILGDGEQALIHIMRLKEEAEKEGKKVSDFVDVVIADIEMPRMDGFTLTKKIKEDALLRDLPVILYSSMITDDLRHKGDFVGADFQISKPDLDKMAEMAISLIEKQK
jgi:two-component system chemotaxis response regulator CheV